MRTSPRRIAASSLSRDPIRADRSNVEVASTPPGQRDAYPGRESNSHAHERDPKGHCKPLGEVKRIVARTARSTKTIATLPLTEIRDCWISSAALRCAVSTETDEVAQKKLHIAELGSIL